MKACASFASPSPAVASMAAAPTASPPPPTTEGKIPKKKIVIDASSRWSHQAAGCLIRPALTHGRRSSAREVSGRPVRHVHEIRVGLHARAGRG
jgi:hypothetical protein